MRKKEVEVHNIDGYGGPYFPAVNVKCYGFDCEIVTKVEKRFGCTRETAERALQWQLEAAQQRFWEDVQEWARECFGSGVEVQSAGRSNGWAVVADLPCIDSWDAIQLSKWAKFTEMCDQGVEYLASEGVILEGIAANRWAEENSEKFNYIDKANGETVCLADVPRCAHCR